MVHKAALCAGPGSRLKTMGRGFGIAATVFALAFASVAVSAHAQSAGKQGQQTQAFTVDPSVWQPAGAAGATRSLQWNGNGRWGLNLDYQNPTTRGLTGSDVYVGPSYRVTRRLHIVGSVNVGDDAAPRFATPDQRPQPRVRLESIFRF
ncbi:MAG TPA: hypothetical protein VGL66_02820 [Caulobacteraceae bacterium]|jgi:hypothetical protein